MEVLETDVLVVGGGGAAVRAAIEASDCGVQVTLIAKGALGESGSTATARSEAMGIAAALGITDSRDSPNIHFRDTIEAGLGLCDRNLVRVLCNEAVPRLGELIKWGVDFETKDGQILQRRSDAGTYARVLTTRGTTGKAILDVLTREARQRPIKILENTMASRLLKKDNAVVGAVVTYLKTEETFAVTSKSTIIATGGAGAIYPLSAFGPEMTGDGYALSYDVGAPLVNMEFVQMGPAVVYPVVRILSGSLWRLRPRLQNSEGDEFLGNYLPEGVSAEQVFDAKAFPFTTRTRAMFLDIAISTEVHEGRATKHGGVFFDISHLPERRILEIAPITFQELFSHGIDLRKGPIEIGIAVQNFNGGVRINERAGTPVPGLFAAGEAAGGVRAPDRPGGNALAECQVFGARAGKFAAQRSKEITAPRLDLKEISKETPHTDRIARSTQKAGGKDLMKAIQDLMCRGALVVRDEHGLQRTMDGLRILEKRDLPAVWRSAETSLALALSLGSALTAAKAVTLSALVRRETRGGHYRADFPAQDDRWLAWILVEKSNGEMSYRTVAPPQITP